MRKVRVIGARTIITSERRIRFPRMISQRREIWDSTFNPRWIVMIGILPKTTWCLMREVELLRSSRVCYKSLYSLSTMNFIIWNSRGVLKPNFQRHICNLVQKHNPTILVVMETKLGGDSAKAITDRLPMDGAIHTNTIGYSGGLWLLWNSDLVEV